MSLLTEVLADLAAESDQLDALVAALPDPGPGAPAVGEPTWRTPTPAAGWDVAHQVAHLAWTDEAAVAACADAGAWEALVHEALADPEGFADRGAREGADASAPELLARWRASRGALGAALTARPEGSRIPWYGPPMSATSMATARFMETWAHARDVAAALGVSLPADDRVRHVVQLGVRTRGFAYRNRGLEPPAEEVRVRLTLPGGDLLDLGPVTASSTLTGSAHDFALVVTRRLHPADADLHPVGEPAREWLAVAQAFAGPPGPGREPR